MHSSCFPILKSYLFNLQLDFDPRFRNVGFVVEIKLNFYISLCIDLNTFIRQSIHLVFFASSMHFNTHNKIFCSICGSDQENINHMLFHGPRAKEVWTLSELPPPPAGFSTNSVFLNMHYLLSCSKNKGLEHNLRCSFPWILWHIWKARNLFCFEQVKLSASEILAKAEEEVSIWFKLRNLSKK